MQAIDSQREQVSLADLDEMLLRVPAGVSIARFAGFDADGRFRVHADGTVEPLVALSTIALEIADVGVPLVIAFENGDCRRPVILGRAHERLAPSAAPVIKADGGRVVIRAEREIELRCGDSSIVLTRAGKVLIRGGYVLSRSRGANKIKGAFVDIN